jgi:apolipoprotein N-acyltransferase
VASLTSCLLVWAALPPWNLSFLAWIAPIGWLTLIRADRLSGRRPYWSIWCSSVLFWILTMQGIRLAHWANYFGLLAMSCYLGIYLPLFIGIARQATHRWKVPLLLAAPISWVGFELLRAYGPLGFSMALLAHTQAANETLIQISDLGGAYAVSFVLMLVTASIYNILPTQTRRARLWSVTPALAVLLATLAYGHFRRHQSPPGTEVLPPLRVALIQGSIDTVFDDNPDRPRETLEQYRQLTEQACQEFDNLDLIVWPETMFPVEDVVIEATPNLHVPTGVELDQLRFSADNFQRLVRNAVRNMNASIHEGATSQRRTSWLLGVGTWRFGDRPPERLNTAMLVDPQGSIVGRYHKMHPVIFGEYVPFGRMFPWLYRLTPMPNGLTPGDGAKAFPCSGWTASPSICFESTIPQLIRGHVADLAREGNSPDVLINLTNDGWFWGSSVLDLQLICAIFRAVELRRPALVAANTGLSAWIDGNGHPHAIGPRRANATLLATVEPDGRFSGYLTWGDLPTGLCAALCWIVAMTGIRWRRLIIRGKRRTPGESRNSEN